jgi:PREDICTED: similar to centromere protein E
MDNNPVYPFVDLYNIFNLYDADSINDLNQHLTHYPDYQWALVNKYTFNIPILTNILKNAIDDNRERIDYWLEKKPGLINSIHSFYHDFITAKDAIQKETEMGLIPVEVSEEKYVALFVRYFPVILLKLGVMDDSSDETVNELINEIGLVDPNNSEKYFPLFLPFEDGRIDLDTVEEVIYPEDNYDDEEEGPEEPKVMEGTISLESYYPSIKKVLEDTLNEFNNKVDLRPIEELINNRFNSLEEKLEQKNKEPLYDEVEVLELQNNMASLTEQINDLENDLEEKESLIENLQGTIKELSDEANNKSEDDVAQIGVLEGEITNLRTELDTRMENESKLRQEVDHLRSQLDNINNNSNDEELRRENNELKEVIKKLNFEKNKLSTENTLLKDAVNNRKINNDNFAPPIVEKVNESANNNLAGQVLRANNNTPTIDENDENIKRLNRFFNKY